MDIALGTGKEVWGPEATARRLRRKWRWLSLRWVVMLRQDGSSTGSLLGWVRCHGRGKEAPLGVPHGSSTLMTRGRLEL